jgi:mannose-6-phosphate isomerase
MVRDESLLEARFVASRGRLREWLRDHAYPRWAAIGVDRVGGGFHEAIGQDGAPLSLPRRARVQARQIYSLAQAARVGWRSNVSGLVRGGLDYLEERFRRPDGLFRTLVDVRGAALDDRPLLCNQAAVLMGLASAAMVLESGTEIESQALHLRDLIAGGLRVVGGEFLSGESEPAARTASPHMHLLGACLEWTTVGSDPGWAQWADDLANVACTRFVSRTSGSICEALTAAWGPAPGTAGRRVEPGHQFEWATLLLRWPGGTGAGRRGVALGLIDIAEQHGVHGGMAVNALLDDLTVHDAGARLWPQTERLKAAHLAYRITGDDRYLAAAADAASAVLRFLDTPLPGLWLDLRRRDGSFADSPAYSSTFYHLVGAIISLDPSPWAPSSHGPGRDRPSS